jgi:hypothetical protein
MKKDEVQAAGNRVEEMRNASGLLACKRAWENSIKINLKRRECTIRLVFNWLRMRLISSLL